MKDEYTPWISSAVVTPKSNGSIRVCLDPPDLNKAIKCNRHYVRSVDDIIPKVAGATHFSILDARSGYWQVKIDEESSKLCTFNTPWGKYRWTRLPFGLTCSGDVFQEKMDSVFGSLDGVTGIADDTFSYGTSEASHDELILSVLDTARKNNMRFNSEKCQFKVAEASFFGLKWTPEGLNADDKKVEAIANMQPPKDVKELQSFLGMVNYLNRFSPVLAQISQPIRNLVKNDAPFQWQAEQQQALQLIKDTISKSPLLAYYDPEKESVIQSDASMYGLGYVLLQDDKPVCYTSRSMTEFPIVRKLSSATSVAVIKHLRSIFSEYDIPETIISDGPQYSKEFKAFCNNLGIEHTTSSPTYQRSNGFSERMVHTVKNILKKADACGEDSYLRLLAYHTTPVDCKLPAPAKLPNHRIYRTQLPSSGRLQRSATSNSDLDQMQHRQHVQKLQHDGKVTSKCFWHNADTNRNPTAVTSSTTADSSIPCGFSGTLCNDKEWSCDSTTTETQLTDRRLCF